MTTEAPSEHHQPGNGGSPSPFGPVALRAFVHHRRGELTSALELLLRGTRDRRLRFLRARGLEWLSEEGAIDRVDIDTALRFLAVLTDTPEARSGGPLDAARSLEKKLFAMRDSPSRDCERPVASTSG